MPGFLIVGVTLVIGCWAVMLYRMMCRIDDQGEPLEDRHS